MALFPPLYSLLSHRKPLSASDYNRALVNLTFRLNATASYNSGWLDIRGREGLNAFVVVPSSITSTISTALLVRPRASCNACPRVLSLPPANHKPSQSALKH
eukprot:scaffold199326_cov14-Prasinocladus_malaysianus.AAC.1